MIGYGHQYIDTDDVEMVSKVLRGELLTCGPMVDAFEAEICKVTGAKYAVAVSNGTSALRLMYKAAGVGPGTVVGVPNITFIATATQAMLLDAHIVLLDVDEFSMLLTPEILERAFERHHMDYVVPVHMSGDVCDLARLSDICVKNDAILLEDSAHAFGSMNAGYCASSLASSFSFHPVKNITCGEGGAVTTNDKSIYQKIKSLRHHGIVRVDGDPWYHEFHEPATNERLSDINAALGVSQCKKLERFRNERFELMKIYWRELKDVSWIEFGIDYNPRRFYNMFIAHINNKDRLYLFESANIKGIRLQVHYVPLSIQPVMRGAARASDLSGSLKAYSEIITLPCYPGLNPQPVIDWIKSI